MSLERKIEVQKLKKQKKELLKQLGVKVLAYKRHFPKVPIRDRNYIVFEKKRHKPVVGQHRLSLKEQVQYLIDLLKIREENKEMFDKIAEKLKAEKENKND